MRRGTRTAAAVLGGLVLWAGLPGDADAARAVTDACPPGQVPEDGFTDTGNEGSRDEAAIDCLAAYKVTLGKTATQYDPAGSVQRQQMATFMMRVFDLVKGATRPASAPNRFPDDSGTHEVNINDAAALGIVRGYTDGRFGSADPVRRDQMAAFIVRLLQLTGATIPANPGNAFADDNGNTHEGAINTLAALDIVEGVSAGTYAPSRFVTRAQMALFLTRTLDFLVDEQRVFALGAIQTYAVSGGRAGVAFGTTRTCAVTVPSGTVVDLALLPSDHITTTAGGAVRFRDADGDNLADRPAVAPEITSVEGDNTKNGDAVLNVTSDGSITVTLSEESSASAVTLVAWADPTNGNDRLDLVPSSPAGNQPKAPAEHHGFGCDTVFGPAEAPAGQSNATVATVDRGLDFFTGTTNVTYFYDTNDAYRVAGTQVTMAAFEGILSSGDVVATEYNPEDSGQSVFNITTDDVRAPTAVTADVVNADGGQVANDVQITFTTNPVNGPGTVYEVQRGQVITPSCGSGGLPPVTWTPIATTTTGSATDRNPPNGCYQYRVVAKNPAPSTSSATSDPSGAVAVPDDEPPTLVDTRLVEDKGVAGQADAGDIHRIEFSEPMSTTTDDKDASYRLRTTGNAVDVICGFEGTVCTLDANRTVLTVTLGTPLPVEPGDAVTYPAMLSAANEKWTDAAGNRLEIRPTDDNQVDTE